MRYVLRMTGSQHALLRSHLFPGDGLEAVCVLLCGRRRGVEMHALSVHDVLLIPHSECVRRRDFLHWTTDRLLPFLERVATDDFAIVKVHSHPGGFDDFSAADTASDRELLGSVSAWGVTDAVHGSAVMLPDGSLFGRVWVRGDFQPLDLVSVAGDDLAFWFRSPNGAGTPQELMRHAQWFGDATLARLRSLSVAVIGCSGTGSHVIEQLARLGVGRLVLVDPDRVERRNLNRILNATAADADARRFKVEVLAEAVERMGLGTRVVLLPESLLDPRVAAAVAECDVLFGCMDAAEGRHVLNRLGAFYALPYFDLGVRIDADGTGGVASAAATVHYAKPGDSLLERGAYTVQQIEAEGLRRTNPTEYESRRREKYIVGADVDRPAVVSVNGQVGSMAVNEFLARLHPFRRIQNGDASVLRLDLMEAEMYGEAATASASNLARHIGRGDIEPMLGIAGLQARI